MEDAIRYAAFNKPLMHDPNGVPYVRANASIISLVRSEELDGIVQSMRELERSFNSKFNYSWIFFNNEPFTDEFKRRTRQETNAECRYGEYPGIVHDQSPVCQDIDVLNLSRTHSAGALERSRLDRQG